MPGVDRTRRNTADATILTPNEQRELQDRLRVRFRDPALLDQALIHRSLLREPGHETLRSNERLEFLGDAIIGALVARHLYDRLPDATEGELTLLRTWLVRASTLAAWAASLDLSRYLRLGRSDEGGKRRTRLLARTFEAVVGAIYADQGVRGVRSFLIPLVDNELKSQATLGPRLDAKSRLQQISQGRFELVPTYTVLNVSGPGHDPTFTVELRVGDQFATTAIGSTKQEAEQAAAAVAIVALEVGREVPDTEPSDAPSSIGGPERSSPTCG